MQEKFFHSKCKSPEGYERNQKLVFLSDLFVFLVYGNLYFIDKNKTMAAT